MPEFRAAAIPNLLEVIMTIVHDRIDTEPTMLEFFEFFHTFLCCQLCSLAERKSKQITNVWKNSNCN